MQNYKDWLAGRKSTSGMANQWRQATGQKTPERRFAGGPSIAAAWRRAQMQRPAPDMRRPTPQAPEANVTPAAQDQMIAQQSAAAAAQREASNNNMMAQQQMMQGQPQITRENRQNMGMAYGRPVGPPKPVSASPGRPPMRPGMAYGGFFRGPSGGGQNPGMRQAAMDLMQKIRARRNPPAGG